MQKDRFFIANSEKADSKFDRSSSSKPQRISRICLMIILIPISLAFASTVHAQFLDHLTNPTVSVTLTHPPTLGLKINKIAFGPASGICADQIVGAMISDFVANGIEVIDRQNLNAILIEHNLSLSGYVDQTSAAEIGRILGPSALVFVKALRCETIQDRLLEKEKRYDNDEEKEYTVPVFISRTRAFLRISIQTVDLTTGSIFAARVLDYSPVQQNKSYERYPDPPAEFDVLDMAIGSAVWETHCMFLPWTEQTELVYYNDKKCGLKKAFNLLRDGKVEGAFRRSLENLEACKVNPKAKKKHLGHAYYNVGMSYMMRDEYDDAMYHFQEAAKLRPGDIVNKAIADCQRAKDLQLAMQQIEEKADFEAEKKQEEKQKAADAEAAIVLTNDDVIKLVETGLSESIIIHKIKNSQCQFDTSAEALVALTEAGISEPIIIAMMEQ